MDANRTSTGTNRSARFAGVPEREAIEQEFVHWLSPRATAEDFEIDFRAIYRHAHACNLFAVRNRNSGLC